MAVCGTRIVLTGRPSTSACCGCGFNLRQRVVHRAVRGLQNVDFVNQRRVNFGDGEFDFAAGGDEGEEFLALQFGELLGIVQAFEFARQAGFRPFRRQNGGGGNDRPGERPAPGLVHARDAREILLPKRALEFKTVGKFGGHGIKGK